MWYFLIRFLGATGARVSELVQFKAEHLRVGYFDLYTKGGKVRRLFVPKELCTEAKGWLRQTGVTSGYLFVDHHSKPITHEQSGTSSSVLLISGVSIRKLCIPTLSGIDSLKTS